MVARGELWNLGLSRTWQKKPESANARKWMVNFAKFNLGCLFFWCLDPAIWLTWYPSCLLVSAWLERSIAFFSVFQISQSESNLVENLESVNARKWVVEFGKFKLECWDFYCVNVEKVERSA